MPKLRVYGPFLIRRPTGRSHRWEYATGRYRTTRLGDGCSVCGPEWTPRRSKAGRWESRSSARRWLKRLAHWESAGTQIVRIGTAAGPPEDTDPWHLPFERQGLLAFMREIAP